MFKLILVLCVLTLTGCDSRIESTMHAQLEKICERNDGFHRAYVDNFNYRTEVTCNDGFSKIVKLKTYQEINKQMEGK